MAIDLPKGKGSAMKYFNEYLFCDTVNRINAQRRELNQPLIMTSDARRLRAEFGKLVDTVVANRSTEGANRGKGVQSLNATEIISTLNTTFESYTDGPVHPEGSFDSWYKPMTQSFREMTGFGSPTVVKEPILPLSPYDPAFENRAIFRQNGGSLLFAKGQELSDIGDFNKELPLYSQQENGLRKVGVSLTEDDESGMSMLMPYMTQKDYADVASWMSLPVQDNPEHRMSDAALERSCAILKALQDDGIEYSIAKDDKPGQIKACLSGTKISVRLTDIKNNERFIGRVYDDGLSFFYRTNKTDFANKAAGQHRKMAYNDVSADDCVRLVRFALGKSVERNAQTDGSEPKAVGETGTYERRAGSTGRYAQTTRTFNEAYHGDGNFTAVVGDYPGDPSSKILLYADNKRSAQSVYFRDPEVASDYLRTAIDSAKTNFENMVDVEGLIEKHRAMEASISADYEERYEMPIDRDSLDEYMRDANPDFSGDAFISRIQQSYWDRLTGKSELILKPGVSVESYDDAIKAINAGEMDTSELQNMVCQGTAEEQIRQHAQLNPDKVIGQLMLDENGKRFDTMNVASYMTSAAGMYRNRDDLVSAMRTMDIQASELLGDDALNNIVANDLIKFNVDTAQPMAAHTSPFIQTMFDTIKTTISQTGVLIDDNDILMDENGVVQYTGRRIDSEKYRDKRKTSEPDNEMSRYSAPITGQIGQIFVPDDMGMVETKFNGPDNYMFVPGYEAYVIPQGDEPKSLEERTRLRGYEQIMADSIRYRIRTDIVASNGDAGSPTSLNATYRRLYDTRYDLGYAQQARLDGMSQDLLNDIIKTNGLRVRYSNDFRDGSTINAEYQASLASKDSIDDMNDNFKAAYRMSGGRNMSVMSESGDGYFDKDATSGSTNQGVTRYLVEGAKVLPDGRIIPSEDLNDQTPLMKNEVCSFSEFNPFDRRMMTFQNLLKASCVAEEVKTAQMTFGGWNFDDGYIVSREFAERYQIKTKDSDGMRGLIVGDKISDMNGNKGVISLVVDPDMSLEEAREKGIEQPVAWFKANKGNLDVVGAPFAAPSRFNGGSVRELMRHPSDLIGPDGTVHEGCIGTANYIITHMAVDEKTHVYDDDDIAEGRGRKASAQLAWAFASQDATKVMDECYSTNTSTLSNLREYLITVGLDIDEVGNFKTEYTPQSGEERAIFEIPELKLKTVRGEEQVDGRAMRADFGDIIGDRGGFLEVPFKLHYPGDKRGMQESPNSTETDKKYLLPIMSSYLRSGQDFVDGTRTVHDFTNSYLSIYENAAKYIHARDKGDTAMMESVQSMAQSQYNHIANSVINTKFEGKHNIFRDGIMANRLANSATAVWTADPRLDIDQVAMPESMGESLGVRENNHVLMWRDPILRDGGLRYVRVKFDNDLTGVAIHPAMDKSYDGDFDGDSVGVAKLHTKAAHEEAMAQLSVGANLLDYGSGSEGHFGLAMQNSLDLKSAAARNPVLAERRAALEAKINETEAQGYKDNKTAQRVRAGYVKELSDYMHDALADEYGGTMVSFKDMPSHIKSVEQMVVSGAKGSYGKLADYARYLGVEYGRVDESIDPAQPIDVESIVDHGKPLTTRQDDMAVQYATAVKSFGTGVAGMYSQRGISALRNICAKAVLETTYPATQSILQSKHDPVEAKHKYNMLMSTSRALWNGYKLEDGVGSDGKRYWQTVRDETGKPVQATGEEFKKQFMDFYTSKDGLGVDIAERHVTELTNALTINGTRGTVMSIEKEAKECYAPAMDRLAYGGKFETLQEAAYTGKNLFEGKYNQHFAPSSVRKNLERQAEGDVLKSISKSDVGVDFESKPKAGKSSVVSVKPPRTMQKSDVDTQVDVINGKMSEEARMAECDTQVE